MKLDYVPVSDKGLVLLKQLPQLKELSLDNTNITDTAVETLQAIPTLQTLDLYHTRITRNGYQTLRSALPQCRIFYDEQSGLAPRRAGKT